VEAQQAALSDANKSSDAALDDRLEKLYRENLKLSEEIQHVIEGKSNDMNLLDSFKILAGLREASEESLAAQLQATQSQRERGGGGKLGRGPKKAGSKSQSITSAVAVSTEDGAEETSAAPSPRIHISGQASRLGAKEGKLSRAGSIPATRETSVKIEDGAESVASSADGGSTANGPTNSKGSSGSRPTNRLVLRKDEIVFCRHDLKAYDPKKGEQPEGEGILCRVTAVIGEGKQRRYEVQDADEQGASPPQRASVSQLIQIPQHNRGLSDLSKGRGVLAQYPDTTTFYKAEVSDPWRSKDMGNEKGELVRLNFQDDELPREVERRFVLTEK